MPSGPRFKTSTMNKMYCLAQMLQAVERSTEKTGRRKPDVPG